MSGRPGRFRAAASTAAAALAFGFAAVVASAADETSPAGLWQSVSDVDGKPSGYIRISEVDGEYRGVIERGVDESRRDELCDKCPGARHNQPKLGMTIITGVHRNGERFDGGEILDPDTGNVYRVRLTPVDGGRKLEVRGYLGISLFGRTQTWLRQP